MNNGIEKLQKYAFGMNPRRCDDILLLADQIKREHASELHTIEERYNTDLQDAREARDIAIKEAAEYKHQLSSQDRYDGIMSELDKRLMPPGMEWPRFEDGEKVSFGVRVDGLGDVCEKYIFTRSQGGVCQLQDANGGMVNVLSRERAKRHEPDVQEAIDSELDKRLMPPGMEWPRFEDGKKITWDDAPEDITAVCLALDGSCYSLHYDIPDYDLMCIYEVSERVKRPVTEMIGADCLPIEVAHTKPDTQERIDDDATMPPRRYYAEKIGNDVDLKDDEEVFTAVALSLMRRQRELDARTMGGDAS